MPSVKSAARPLACVSPRAATTAGERAFQKQRCGVESREYSARRAGLDDPRTKRIKAATDGAGIKKAIVPANSKMPIDPAQQVLRNLKKRQAVELDTLRDLVKKANKILSRGKNDEPRLEAPVVAGDKAPPAKKRKMSPILEQIAAQQMSPEPVEGETVTAPEEEDEEYIDICGGVSPIAIREASALLSLEKADQSKTNNVPVDHEEYADICGGVVDATPLAPAPLKVASEACSPTSSSRDSGSSLSSTKPEKKVEGNVPVSVLLARAKEAREIREQKGNGWEREKTRRALREMEKAVQPDESIDPQHLAEVGIKQFDYVLRDLGFFLKRDANAHY